jgi:ubiquinone/menaquinone biosynthesis C-methylase UbiE
MPDAKTYWDRHVSASNLPGDAALTAATWPEQIAFYLTPEQEFAHRALGPLESRRVIEIGCGVGVHAIYMARRGARVAAVDASLERLKVLRDVAAEMGLRAHVHPVCARAESLPFRADSFDAAYSKASLIHTDLPAALGECRRVLCPAGRGVFCEPTTSNPFARLYRRLCGPREWRVITRYFSRAEESIMKDTFGNFRAESFYLWAFLAFYWQFGRRNLKRFRRWLGFLCGFDRALFALCPPLKRLAWFRVYVVEKKG